MNEQKALRPLLRWAGSKRQVLSRLVPYWQPGARYLEPFAGSACLFFCVQPEIAVLGDINAELIDTLDTVRGSPRVVYNKLCQMPKSKRLYYKLRNATPKKEIDKAVRFLYLNRFC
jgi:DNA adenine methylase